MQSLTEILENLNPNQRDAVETIEGPVLVVAGPGTGKTQVLAARIANILEQTDAAPGNVLCLTFTESGVLAMRKRLLQMIGKDAYYVRIHTFHSFANDVIQSNPEKFSFARELKQIDDLGRIKMIRQVIDTLTVAAPGDQHLFPFYNKYMHESSIISKLQDLKREGWTPDSFTNLVQAQFEELESLKEINPKTGKPKTKWSAQAKIAQKNIELARIYTEYQSELQESGLYDYEDMILFVLKQFEEDDELLADFQERFLYILVDEYQDTNGAQNKILKALGSFDDSPNIFAVGDDDQAIYRFQGANIENIMFFNSQFSNVKTISLNSNYRSTQVILDAATSLISHNQARLVNELPDLTKHLQAEIEKSDQPIDVFELETGEQENQLLVKKIQELISQGVDPNEIAILYRRHRDGEDIAESLMHAGVPVRLTVGRNALTERIVLQLLDLLRVVDYRDLEIDPLLARVLFFEWLGLDKLEVFKLVHQYNLDRISLWEQMLAGESVELKQLANKIVEWKAASQNETVVGLLQKIADDTGLLKHLFADGKDNWEDISSFNSFFSFVRTLNNFDPELRVPDLLADIELLKETRTGVKEQEIDTDQSAVQMMTVHGSKGLEFQYVFIPKFYNGNWGGYKRREIIKLPSEVFDLDGKENIEIDNVEEEDERRLAFVAITRARKGVIISHANQYNSGGSVKQVAVSAFLSEIDQQQLDFSDAGDLVKPDPEYTHAQLKPLPKITRDEQVYLAALVQDFKLSASSLNEYLECPLKFKYNRLLRLPQPTARPLVLGTAIHYALEQVSRAKMKGEEVDLDTVQGMFVNKLKRELLSKKDFEEISTEGKQILSKYFEHYADQSEDIAEIEYFFSGKGTTLELSGQDPVQLTGKIDKVVWVDQDSSEVKLVDYKTSTPKSANFIKGETAGSDGSLFRQLVFYKLVTELDPDFRPGLNKPKYQVSQVELDFLKPNASSYFKRESFEVTAENVDWLKQTISEVMTNIRNLEFEEGRCGECEWCQAGS